MRPALRPRPDVFARPVEMSRTDRDRLLALWTSINGAHRLGDGTAAVALPADQLGALQRLLEQLA